MKKHRAFLFLLMLPLIAIGQLDTITEVTITFSPEMGEEIIVEAQLVDDRLIAGGEISLQESTSYDISVAIMNDQGGVNDEIVQNASSYQLFYEFTEEVLARQVTYLDMDSLGLPLGLQARLTSNCTLEGDKKGDFTISLNALNMKSASSTIQDGDTLFILSWPITVVDDPAAPECENEEEVIDRVTLTFGPTEGGDTVVAVASDPDGPGPQDLVVEDIELVQNTTYELSIKVENTIEGDNITEEIAEEDEEHQFYFAWTEHIFSDPTGDGNVDGPDGPVNYLDFDENGLPVGLRTTWTTMKGMQSGTFRIALKHQPDMKSNTSSFEDGGTDLDILWNINSIVTSAHETNQATIRVWPNPTRDYLIVESLYTGKLSETAVILDYFGRVVLETKRMSRPIDVSDLSAGTYYIRMKSQPTQIAKFVVLN